MPRNGFSKKSGVNPVSRREDVGDGQCHQYGAVETSFVQQVGLSGKYGLDHGFKIKTTDVSKVGNVATYGWIDWWLQGRSIKPMRYPPGVIVCCEEMVD